jgi:hypothetical protein
MTIRLTRGVPILLLTGLLASSCTAQALPIRPTIISGGLDNALTVHGHSELRARPDIAYATLGVTTQSTSQTTAVSTNAQRVKAVIAALKKDGLPDKDIQTQYYTVQPQYDYSVSPAVSTGFQVENAVRVTVRDLSKAGAIIDDATNAGATDVSSLSFDLSDRNRVQGQALIAAVANARSKADLLAGAAGVDVGRVLDINEDSAPSVTPIEYSPGRKLMAAAMAPTTPIQSQDITVTADVTVSYAISATQK